MKISDGKARLLGGGNLPKKMSPVKKSRVEDLWGVRQEKDAYKNPLPGLKGGQNNKGEGNYWGHH